MWTNVRKGMWAVAVSFAAYAALYWHHVIAAGLPLDAQFSYFAGSCSVICMVLGMLLSTRPRAVETSFGGLDRMYRLHKHLGVAAMLLFMAHFATVPGGPEEDGATASTVSGRRERGNARADRRGGRGVAHRPLRPDRDDRFHPADPHHG